MLLNIYSDSVCTTQAITVDQRQRLLQGNQIVDQSSDRLANAHRLALQNEEIGSEIILSLGEQREQIERSYDKVRPRSTLFHSLPSVRQHNQLDPADV